MGESLNRPCPVCGQQSAKAFLRKAGFELVRCQSCSMIYTNPVLAEIATGVFYDRAGGEHLSPEKLESDYSDVRFQRELRLFRNFCQTGAVLDVGCSSGAFLYELNKRYPNDYQICGTDVSGRLLITLPKRAFRSLKRTSCPIPSRELTMRSRSGRSWNISLIHARFSKKPLPFSSPGASASFWYPT